ELAEHRARRVGRGGRVLRGARRGRRRALRRAGRSGERAAQAGRRVVAGRAILRPDAGEQRHAVHLRVRAGKEPVAAQAARATRDHVEAGGAVERVTLLAHEAGVDQITRAVHRLDLAPATARTVGGRRIAGFTRIDDAVAAEGDVLAGAAAVVGHAGRIALLA